MSGMGPYPWLTVILTVLVVGVAWLFIVNFIVWLTRPPVGDNWEDER